MGSVRNYRVQNEAGRNSGTTENGCGAAGGDGPYGHLPGIDPVPPGHEHGRVLAIAAGNPGQLADRESSGTDSEEDLDGSDDHKLDQIRHAIEGTKQPVQVILNGRYRWGDGWESVSYCRTFKERTAFPEIMEYLRITAEAIGVLAVQAGATSFPIGIQALGVDRELLEVTVVKRGPGIPIYFERKEEAIGPKTVHQLRFRAMFWEGLSIVFGTGAPATDGEISARLSSITASWLGDHFGESWQVRLSAEPKTSDMGDEIYAKVLLANDDSWEGIRRIPGLPSVETPLATSIAATKIEEAVSLIQYVSRDRECYSASCENGRHKSARIRES
jgi:hypothetical protein